MMKKYLISLFLFYHLASTSQVTQEPSEFIRTGAFEAQTANLGPGCRIKVDLPKGEQLGPSLESEKYRGRAGFSIRMPPNFSHNGEWGFEFICYHTNDKNFQEAWRNRSAKNEIDFIIEDGRKIFTDAEGVRRIPFQSVNAEGWTLLFDDTTGEENFRLRHLWYCIKSKESAICGNSDIGYLDFINNKKNIDITSYAFRVLESIEFLEDAPPN